MARQVAPKPHAQGHRKRAPLVVVPEIGLAAQEPPKPPPGLLPVTKKKWEVFWTSDVAGIIRPEHGPAVERLFRMRDEHERAMRVLRKARIVRGSTGQPRMNPMGEYALKLETAIGRLETELGLTPMARAKLGLAVGQAELTLSELSRMAQENRDEDPIEVKLLEEFEEAD